VYQSNHPNWDGCINQNPLGRGGAPSGAKEVSPAREGWEPVEEFV